MAPTEVGGTRSEHQGTPGRSATLAAGMIFVVMAVIGYAVGRGGADAPQEVAVESVTVESVAVESVAVESVAAETIGSTEPPETAADCPASERIVGLRSMSVPFPLPELVGSAAGWYVIDLGRSRCAAGLVIESLLAGGPGYVALGSHIPAPGAPRRAMVWTSADGLDWRRTPAADGVLAMADRHVRVAGAAAVAGEIIAVGESCTRGIRSCRPEVWSSPDGETWLRLPMSDGSMGDGVALNGATGDDGVIVFGSAADRAAIWLRDDDGQWQRVLEGDPGSEVALVVRNGGGTGWAAFGTVPAAGAIGARSVVWVSTDTRSWSEVTYEEEVFGGALAYGGIPAIRDAMSVPAGFLAVGQMVAGDFRPAVWAARDGREWSLVYEGDDLGALAGVARLPGAILTWGRGVDTSPVFASGDGTTWEPVAAVASFAGDDRVIGDVVTVAGTVTAVAVGPTVELWTRPGGKS